MQPTQGPILRLECPATGGPVANFFRNIRVSPAGDEWTCSTEGNQLVSFGAGLERKRITSYYNTAYDYLYMEKSPGVMVVSCRDDPIRFLRDGKTVHMEYIKKPNSEDFLSALNLDGLGHLVCLAGKSMARVYDSEKQKFTSNIFQSHKKLGLKAKQAASCCFLDENLVALGFFSKELMVLDRRSAEGPVLANSIHFDGVLSLMRLDSGRFFSGARMDDFVYLWVAS